LLRTGSSWKLVPAHDRPRTESGDDALKLELTHGYLSSLLTCILCLRRDGRRVIE
jgi:hypothetical protein